MILLAQRSGFVDPTRFLGGATRMACELIRLHATGVAARQCSILEPHHTDTDLDLMRGSFGFWYPKLFHYCILVSKVFITHLHIFADMCKQKAVMI
ncbi:hypothetical protein LguiA_011125 [Lonicera macranthoides]